MNRLLVLLLSVVLLACLCSAEDPSAGSSDRKQQQQRQRGKKKTKDGEEESDGFNDYEVYEAMDSMRQLAGEKRLPELPEHGTFYDLMGVRPSATEEEIGRSFRKLSVKYHPDKHGPGTTKMFKLVQYVSTLLRDRKRRKRYDWILHEAPAWHRESVYMARRVATVAKLSLRQALLFSFLLALLGQLLGQWVAFAIQYGRILASRQSVRAMGEKEVKRIRKKLEAGDSAALSQNNSDCETVMLADSARPAFPSPLGLFVFALPVRLVRRLCACKPVAVGAKSE